MAASSLARRLATAIVSLGGPDAVVRARALKAAAHALGRRRLVALTVRRLHGGHPPPAPGAPIVLCVVKNGAAWLPAFVDHHVKLGFAHIVLLDNGSTDGTPDLARGHAGVTVLRCSLPYEGELRGHLLERYGRDRWVLLTDIDMLFDFPLADTVTLPGLLRYLDAHRYTALATYLLDMFPEGALEDTADAPGGFLASHRHYDVSAVESLPYPDHLGCRLGAASITRRVGGIRKTVFGLDRVELVHHPLLRYRPDMWFGNPHYVRHAHVADVAGVMYHYKFVASFREQVADAVRRNPRWSNAGDNRRYLDVLASAPRLTLRRPGARRLEGIGDLVESGFLPLSARYRAWAEAREAVRRL
jgi:hypothetical protein